MIQFALLGAVLFAVTAHAVDDPTVKCQALKISAVDACLANYLTVALCAAGEAHCAGSCIDVATDEANCGGCGNVCAAGAVCIAGSCTPSCAPEGTDCSGVCVNLDTDEDHCGTCRVACAGGEVCNAGSCVLL